MLDKNFYEEHGDKFCAAPFTSFYIGQSGRVSTCCVSADSLGNVNENELEDIFNNETFKKIRSSFLKNQFPYECRNCENIEKSTKQISSVREDMNDFARYNIKKVIKLTKDDGTLTEQHPVWLDLLWSNKCNFACMGCTGDLSSTISKKYNSAYSIVHDNHHRVFANHQWDNDRDKKIDYILKHKDSIKLLHLNGGEPFIQEGIHELLDVLLKNNLQKKIRIWSHTNGSITTYKGIDIVEDYLKHWGDNCHITMSHDCHGDKGEYIRYGLKQKKWLSTFNRLKEQNIKINIQSCYSVFNALSLVELYQWYQENTFGVDLKIYPWQDPFPFTAKFLQIDKQLLHMANEEIALLKNYRNIKWNLDELYSFLNSDTSDKDFSRGKKLFQRSIKQFDILRKTDFLKTFPELINLYEN